MLYLKISFKLNILHNISLSFIMFSNCSLRCLPGRCDILPSFSESVSALAESPPCWGYNISGLLIFPGRRLRQHNQRHQNRTAAAEGQLSTLVPTPTAPSGHSAKFYANSFIEKDSAELFFVCLLCNEHNSFLPQLLREWTKWILPFRIPKARRKPPTSVRQCGRQACSLSLGNPRDLEGATWLPPKLARESNLQMEPWNQQKTMKENDQPKYHLQEATDGPECSSRKRESCHTLPRHTPAVVCIVLLVLLKAKHIPIKAILIPLSLSQ